MTLKALNESLMTRNGIINTLGVSLLRVLRLEQVRDVSVKT